MRAQAKHLMTHKTRANWLLREMNGVHSFATLFPDLPESSSLRRDSARIFAEAAREQLLPDGRKVRFSQNLFGLLTKSPTKKGNSMPGKTEFKFMKNGIRTCSVG